MRMGGGFRRLSADEDEDVDGDAGEDTVETAAALFARAAISAPRVFRVKIVTVGKAGGDMH